MKRLSDDALWLWHELDELGLEALADELMVDISLDETPATG